VHEDVDAFEERLELGSGDIDEVELEPACASAGWAHVEADDARDRRVVGERGEQALTDQPGFNPGTSRCCRLGSVTWT
jgi:hypothetical protein